MEILKKTFRCIDMLNFLVNLSLFNDTHFVHFFLSKYDNLLNTLLF